MEYKTTDTPLAAFLVTQGYVPSAIDYSNPPRFEIIFVNTSETINGLASQYTAGLSRVEPITFNRILRKLNRILRNQQQWGDD